MSKTLIYALLDPETNKIRYIGKSSVGMARPKQHFRPAILNKEKSHKNNWIKQLIAKGLEPKIKIIAQVENPSDLSDAEIFCIAYFRYIGEDLTNGTDGGEGSLGRKMTDTMRIALYKANKGRPRTEEQKDHMRKIMTGRIVSYETREKLRVLALNKRHSEETKQKLRYPKSVEHKRKLSISRGGKPFVDENGNVYNTQKEAALALGCCQVSVGDVLSGKFKQTKGHTFRYL